MLPSGKRNKIQLSRSLIAPCSRVYRTLFPEQITETNLPNTVNNLLYLPSTCLAHISNKVQKSGYIPIDVIETLAKLSQRSLAIYIPGIGTPRPPGNREDTRGTEGSKYIGS